MNQDLIPQVFVWRLFSQLLVQLDSEVHQIEMQFLLRFLLQLPLVPHKGQLLLEQNKPLQVR
jgi:hypothetical protein